MSPLANIVTQSQNMLSAVLEPGDLAVDLTAGRGADTLFLARCVGAAGLVLAFDIQEQALTATADRLHQAGIPVQRSPICSGFDGSAGVVLVAASHDRLADVVTGAPRGIIANLGYLPGGDQSVITRPDTTLTALRQATAILAVGGRLAVVVYPGHPGGREEGAAVDQFFSVLPIKKWNVLRIAVPNSAAAPYLLVAEKRAG